MSIVSTRIREEREYRGISEQLQKGKTAANPHPARLTGLSEGARAAFYRETIRDIRAEGGKGPLIVVPDEKEGIRLQNALTALGCRVLVYPFRDLMLHNIASSHEYEQERIAVLCSVLTGDYDAVIATPDAALQFTIPAELLAASIRRVSFDRPCDPAETVNWLVSVGYVRTEMVDGVGQFAVRGGILDIFPPDCEHPVRMELFDDEIDVMGIFDVISQRKIEDITSFTMAPARELVLSSERRKILSDTVLSLKKKASSEQAKEIFSEELEEIGGGGELRFLDKYVSVVYPERRTLLSYFPAGTPVFVQEYAACSDRIEAYEWHDRQAVEELLSSGALTGPLAVFGQDGTDFDAWLSGHNGVIVDAFASSLNDIRLSGLFSFRSRQTVSYGESFPLLTEDLKGFLSAGTDVVILTENEIMAKNLKTMLSEQANIGTVVTKDADSVPGGVPVILYGLNIPGYELPDTRFAVMSTYPKGSGFSRVISPRKKLRSKKSAQEKIMSYADLTEGDYVVHVNHGIGMYLGLQTVTVDGVTRDFVKIQYAGNDMLYLPCNQLDAISKYIGARSEDGTLKLSKMGGGDWVKSKSRVKAAAKEMAKELIKLYAARERKKGFAFDRDDEMQSEFEAAFPYEETDGQLTAVREIKEDMERSRPMDRLLCGDVGFGKTEVALRAAFKAVQSGKQVAVLVPTTILAMQHYQTFLSRMRGFPVNVDMISRFRTQKQQEATIRALRRGEVDILVGTHRLISNDISFRDLGLVIVDEEQRFGVAAKEKLKQMTENVDVLTLTATPIPRTLNMAMSGIRDMSILEEAPGDRLPVQTYVLEYDDLIIGEAIRKELRRGGQVFYLFNRVETIDYVAGKVRQLAPEARIAVAHGQMDKEMLSDIWRGMLAGEIDILISTTIIESGVDVPNANTLIIENAERLGLAQLHQIRGRVGRSSRRAYAYFTYPKGMSLTDIATKRLSAIREYTEFGSGFKVALRDLEIRGAGNLLGAEQHGHIDTVGYDLYMKLLNEAVLEEKGEKKEKRPECTVDLNINAYIPESYIKTAGQRIEAYKKIALIENDEDYRDIIDELLDRYGNVPQPVSDLIQISYIRVLGGIAGMTKIEHKGGFIVIYPLRMDAKVWSRLVASYPGRLGINMSITPYAVYKIGKGDFPLEVLLDLFKKYIQIEKENTVESGGNASYNQNNTNLKGSNK